MRTLLTSLLLMLVGLPQAFSAEPEKFEVTVKTDIAYGTDKERNILDVYIPKGVKKAPVVIFVHGGAWVFGNKSVFSGPGKMLAEQGIVTVSTNYRLSPKVKHPEHIKDIAKAFAWTVDHVAEYGGDPGKICLTGHSAGGHLVALLATDESYLKAEKKSFADIRGVAPISGVFTIDARAKFYKDIFGEDEEVCRGGSPIHNIGKNHPQFLILHADKDMAGLSAQAEAFHAAMKKEKNATEILQLKDRTHLTILTSAKDPADPVAVALRDFVRKQTK